MKRLLTILSLIAIVAMPVAVLAEGEAAPYEWSISDSNQDPFVNTDTTTGFHTVYLWFACSRSANDGGPGGMAAAEFALVTTPPGANLHVASNVVNGYLNAGSATNLLLAVGGCPTGPVVAANLLVIINVPGNMDLAPSSTQTKGTVDCAVNPSLWPIDWRGIGFLGLTPHGKGKGGCTPVSVEESTWGSIKGLYR